MQKLTTRKEIGEFLEPGPKRDRQSLASLTMDALEATLKGLEAGTIRCDYARDYAAMAMGYLLSGCPEDAAWAARQAVMSEAIGKGFESASASELLVGVAKLRRQYPKGSRIGK